MVFRHVPVMVSEVISYLNCGPGKVFADCTVGGAGHARAILEHIAPDGLLIGIDQDMDAINHARHVLSDHALRIRLYHDNFINLPSILYRIGINAIDGVLADLGLSLYQIESSGRGFSFRRNEPLDMRMNRSATLDAFKVINNYEGPALERIFREYGEITNAAKLAASIIEARMTRPVETTSDLKSIVTRLIPRTIEMKYLSQVFQAIRIEVNDEMASLSEFLTSALEALKPGGRLAVITYHSLESRITKNFFRSGNFEGEIVKDFYGNVITPFRLVNKKAVVPSTDETVRNPRARSAKLRIVEKI